jgi:hypothetical protein
MENSSTRMSPKDFFLHLGAMVALYISSISLLALLFEIIDNAFPNSLSYYGDPYSTGITLAIASLIIIYPLYLLFTWLVHNDYEKDDTKKNLGIRKWLVYLTLFVAGIAIAVDLIVLIQKFLGGEEITTGFLLKVVSVLVVTGIIFCYYIYDIKGKIVRSRARLIAGIVSLLVLLTIVIGFVVMGSPRSQRLARYDMQKISDLQNIQSQIVYSYWQTKGVLPTTLGDLADPISGFGVPLDPQTRKAYEYSVVSKYTFKLCADFNRDSSSTDLKGSTYPRAVGFENESWVHKTGNVCFERTIDPEKYPVTTPPIKK